MPLNLESQLRGFDPRSFELRAQCDNHFATLPVVKTRVKIEVKSCDEKSGICSEISLRYKTEI